MAGKIILRQVIMETIESQQDGTFCGPDSGGIEGICSSGPHASRASAPTSAARQALDEAPQPEV